MFKSFGSVVISTAVFATQFAAVSGQTWCNKYYMASSPVVPPGGLFPTPGTSTEPLLAFTCTPAIKPYLAEDSDTPASILIDSVVTYTQINGAVPVTLPDGLQELLVSVSIDGLPVIGGLVPVNASAHALPFSLAEFKPQKDAYNVSCTATLAGQTFHASSTLNYLPNPTVGAVAKMDYTTGAVLAKPADGSEGPYAPVFGIGFYTNFDGYLSTNLSILNELKEQGFTIVHPIPTFDNATALEEVLDRMEEVGLYLMYDMRFSYMNNTAVTEQVNMIKQRKNLLLWYTADEPDGTSDPLNATTLAYDQINALDGYHPVSLVLNCENYDFSSYQNGADIVMQDAYMIDINATWSIEWDAPCTPDFGDCGCDNCKGEFEDISTRLDEFNQRLEILGERRVKSLWTVSQAFGAQEYWPREPTGQEWVVQSLLGVNHGALGIVPWSDPTTADIKASASALALALPSMTPFFFDPSVQFRGFAENRIDVGVWTSGSQTLVLAVNLNYAAVTLSLASVLPGVYVESAKQVFNSGGSINITSGGGKEIALESVGSAAFVLSH